MSISKFDNNHPMRQEDIKSVVKCAGNHDDTLLHRFCMDPGNIKPIKTLVGRGANIEFENNVGRTPIHFACRYNNLEYVRYLVKKGANILKEDHYGLKPIDQTSNSEIKKFLREKEDELNIKETGL